MDVHLEQKGALKWERGKDGKLTEDAKWTMECITSETVKREIKVSNKERLAKEEIYVSMYADDVLRKKPKGRLLWLQKAVSGVVEGRICAVKEITRIYEIIASPNFCEGGWHQSQSKKAFGLLCENPEFLECLSQNQQRFLKSDKFLFHKLHSVIEILSSDEEEELKKKAKEDKELAKIGWNGKGGKPKWLIRHERRQKGLPSDQSDSSSSSSQEDSQDDSLDNRHNSRFPRERRSRSGSRSGSRSRRKRNNKGVSNNGNNDNGGASGSSNKNIGKNIGRSDSNNSSREDVKKANSLLDNAIRAKFARMDEIKKGLEDAGRVRVRKGEDPDGPKPWITMKKAELKRKKEKKELKKKREDSRRRYDDRNHHRSRRHDDRNDDRSSPEKGIRNDDRRERLRDDRSRRDGDRRRGDRRGGDRRDDSRDRKRRRLDDKAGASSSRHPATTSSKNKKQEEVSSDDDSEDSDSSSEEKKSGSDEEKSEREDSYDKEQKLIEKRKGKVERRIDASDGNMYSLAEFIDAYGGTEHNPPKMWINAKNTSFWFKH